MSLREAAAYRGRARVFVRRAKRDTNRQRSARAAAGQKYAAIVYVESLARLSNRFGHPRLGGQNAVGRLAPAKTSIGLASATNRQRDIVPQADQRHDLAQFAFVAARVMQPDEKRIGVVAFIVLRHHDALR